MARGNQMGGPGPSRVTRRGFLGGTVGVGLFALVGCVAPPPSGPPRRLSVLAATHPVEAVQRLIAEHLEAAGTEAGLTVELQAKPTSLVRSTLAQIEASGSWPDLVLGGAPDSVALAARGQLSDLRETLDRVTGLVGDLFTALSDLAGSGAFLDLAPGQPAPVWAIPYLSRGSALLVRRDRLGAEGIAAPNTFDEVRAVAERLIDTPAGLFGWGAGLPLDDATDNLAQVVLLTHGVPCFDRLGERVILDPGAAANALGAFGRLDRTEAGRSLAPTGAANWALDDLANAFAEGKVAQTIDPGGLYARLVTAQPKLREVIQALPLPGGPAGRYAAATTLLFVVPSPAGSRDQARALIERALRPERYDALAQAGQGSAIPPYAYQTKGPFWDEDPNFAVLVSATRGDPARNYQYANLGTPAPATGPVAAVRGALLLAAALRRIVVDQVDPSIVAATLREEAIKYVQASHE